MRLLLDTHSLIWALQGSNQLSADARRQILDPAHEIWMSAVSVYEYGLQVRLGRMTPFPLPIAVESLDLGCRELSITPEHAGCAASFPLIHRDPWDRILAAQAILEDMSVVTRDPSIAALGAPTIW
jgi:PIN domain nuclease of toxin-antitoxin system